MYSNHSNYTHKNQTNKTNKPKKVDNAAIIGPLAVPGRVHVYYALKGLPCIKKTETTQKKPMIFDYFSFNRNLKMKTKMRLETIYDICFQFWIYNKSNGSVTLHAKLFILYSENKFIYC